MTTTPKTNFNKIETQIYKIIVKRDKKQRL